jgi:preprotein translocase subunit SecE
MARNRQRAKQRQAERRAARLSSTRPDAPQPDAPQPDAADEEETLEQAELEAGAPPSDLGFSDATLEAEEAEDLAEADLEADELEEQAEEAEPSERRRARADDTPAHGRRRHNRLVSFLIAVVAELRRVEWPDRQTLTMLTGVVLLFVIVMGAYLGLLDAVFSKVIDKIL